ncbi:hypothetical protein [Magnetospirillum sp. SS-4]|uniref:hypothetical protein n=1 Tax=Magnetospirillum sp. SS-4 TaxID=2681465 RepID=UPI0013809637|nr:hypothetical protein [Magnetospirillum sp. SS-4]CAA7617386.1 hypothetical protein MTBSS4_190011 [Magnetospirillum sp. SS-4]
MFNPVPTPVSHSFLRCSAENDKETTLIISVFAGRLFLNIFKRGLDKPDRLHIARIGCLSLKDSLQNAINGQPGEKREHAFCRRDHGSKKEEWSGTLVIGKDDKHMIYLGLVTPNVQASKFVITVPSDMEMSISGSDIDRSVLGARALIEQLSCDIPNAILLTTQKKESQTPGNGYGRSPHPSNSPRTAPVF